jgi:single-stranded-DNA-specific exonuclease
MDTALKRRWKFHDKKNDESLDEISSGLGITRNCALLLANRGIHNVDEARFFLSAGVESLHDPFLMLDMEKVVHRIKKAKEENERVIVFGDYDVDGVTATAILIRALKDASMDVIYNIPNRLEEGYGLNAPDIEKARANGATLLITVDCGISDYDQVTFANSLGFDVIVTDHHEPPLRAPAAYAILNPKRTKDSYPFKFLAGVGVAFKLLEGLEKIGVVPAAMKYLDLVALGTVADIVPLTGENRLITKAGLELISKTSNQGLLSLINIAGIKRSEITTTDIGYILAPRVNAAGRIGSPETAIRLFLTDDPKQAMALASRLDQDNQKRQALENAILAEVEAALAQGDRNNVITLASDSWHAGVIGIVASKIKERYYKPVVLISLDETEGRGSARSIEEFSVVEALASCEDLLIRYGGHKLAAGFSVKRENIEPLKQRLNALATRMLGGETPVSSLVIDAEIKMRDISSELIGEVNMLKPFGQGNPCPLFLARDLSITGPRRIGSNAAHLKMKVGKNGKNMDAIAFNMGGYSDRLISPAQSIDLVFEVEESRNWGDSGRLQMKVRDFRISTVPYTQASEPEAEFAGRSSEELKELGNKYFLLKDYKKAQACYSRALESSKRPSELHFNIGLIKHRQGRYDEALNHFEAALESERDATCEIVKRARRMIGKIKDRRKED